MKYWLGTLIAIATCLAPARPAVTQADFLEEAGFPARFADELSPEANTFNGWPWDEVNNRFVTSHIEAAYGQQNYWVRMLAIAPDAGSPIEQPDFAVILATPWKEHRDKYRVVGVSLPISSSWYRQLLTQRIFRLGQPADIDDLRRAARSISLEAYSDIREEPGDEERTRELKQRIAKRLGITRLRSCTAKLDLALGDRVVEAMRGTLSRTRYLPHDSLIVDGSKGRDTTMHDLEFHFSDGEKSGTAPRLLLEGTRPALMVAAGLAMRDYCLTQDKAALNRLMRAIEGLEKRLPDDSKFEASRQ